MRVIQPIPMIGWTLSIGLHVGAALLLLGMPVETRGDPKRSQVAFSVVSRTESDKPLPPMPQSDPPTRSKAAPKPVTVAAIQPAVSKSAASPVPVDLTGVTLTAGEGASWSSVTGNGQAIEAPIRPGVAAAPQPEKPNTHPVALPKRVPRSETVLVALKDLSAKPVPPPLNAQLLNNYPAAAKRQGIAGKAVVVARIDADGVVRTVRIFFESVAGFGAACQKTLLGSRWSEPRTRGGEAVNTQIYYTCDFRVDG